MRCSEGVGWWGEGCVGMWCAEGQIYAFKETALFILRWDFTLWVNLNDTLLVMLRHESKWPDLKFVKYPTGARSNEKRVVGVGKIFAFAQELLEKDRILYFCFFFPGWSFIPLPLLYLDIMSHYLLVRSVYCLWGGETICEWNTMTNVSIWYDYSEWSILQIKQRVDFPSFLNRPDSYSRSC